MQVDFLKIWRKSTNFLDRTSELSRWIIWTIWRRNRNIEAQRCFLLQRIYKFCIINSFYKLLHFLEKYTFSKLWIIFTSKNDLRSKWQIENILNLISIYIEDTLNIFKKLQLFPPFFVDCTDHILHDLTSVLNTWQEIMRYMFRGFFFGNQLRIIFIEKFH